MKIAILTGLGMDVKCMTHFLLSLKYHVVVCTRRTTNLELDSFKENFQNDLIKNPDSKLSLKYMDVTDSNSVLQCITEVSKQIGFINELYHLAAASHVGYSYETPVLNIETNGMSSFYILEALRNVSPTTKFYFAATTELYAGNINDERYTENSKFHPKTPYGCSKALGFYWTQYFRETYGMFACSGVLGNHSCCERHNSFFIKKLTQTAAKIAIGKEKELRIGHLNWARDEFWADFGVEAMWKMLQLDSPEDILIANGQCKWGNEYVDIVFNYFNLNQSRIVLDKKFIRLNEVVKLEVDPSKAIKYLKWKTNRMPFKEHLELMCKYDFELETGNNPKRPNVFDLYP